MGALKKKKKREVTTRKRGGEGGLASHVFRAEVMRQREPWRRAGDISKKKETVWVRFEVEENQRRM